ncbi:putative xyloglucan:xyloglucosyl transferase [Rosa chinensis]|uniref:Xyloglucan endotransglucosylase/hydrolase n=1 Tax=Rosa chinensis TaxID=74649 RepID=A0A2P6PU91_ROSCH|nr:putative xyloglucan:xyloglucosyl transferase [Rosa chinensis]
MRIKIPLTTEGDRLDEMDFEFLGNREGKPFVLQTNVITNGDNREQRILFWFDPNQIFMTTKLFGISIKFFYVDDKPIRVYKNNENIRVPYPSRPMIIDASIWDGSNWETDGGQTKIDWNHALFRAYFQGFDISSGCTLDKSRTDVKECYASTYLWNHQEYWQLNSTEQQAYEKVRKEQMNYDYCTDSTRFPTPPQSAVVIPNLSWSTYQKRG